jgi:pyruvate dehydrogenase E2 component (dihydrolipoamide acetyltransferase)
VSARGRTHVEAPTRVQRTMARRAAEARATIPNLDIGAEVNMGRALSLCEQGSHSLAALLIRACALALREHPRANATYRDGQFELHSRVNVGLFIPSGDELVSATVFDADRKPLKELTESVGDLQSRGGSWIQPERLYATFTLSHHEGAGVGWEIPVVWSGQSAAAAAGEIREVPVVQGRDVVAGRVMTLTLACDHRILYGTLATRFLARIKELLEHGPL